MKVQTTTVIRGKKPLEASELKPNGIYAVRHVLPVEVMKAWHVGEQVQWGIVVLNASFGIRAHYHVTRPYEWSDEQIKLEDVQLYKSSQLERDFAFAYDTATSMTTKCQQLTLRLTNAQRKVEYYATNTWHKVAERLARFFS